MHSLIVAVALAGAACHPPAEPQRLPAPAPADPSEPVAPVGNTTSVDTTVAPTGSNTENTASPELSSPAPQPPSNSEDSADSNPVDEAPPTEVVAEEPEAASVLPNPDEDGDGIPDAEDQCPGQPEDHDGHNDDDGCPDVDNDEDGIPDDADRCPDDPTDMC